MLNQHILAGLLNSVTQIVTLPSVGSSPVVAYAMRRVISGYTGNLARIVRTSDSSTLNIPQDISGNADVSGVSSFLSGTFGRIDTLYDQTGAGNHATQTTAALRPGFALTSAINGSYPISIGQNDAAGGMGFTVTYLNIPSGVSVGRQSFTALHVMSAGGVNNNGGHYSLGTDTTNNGTGINFVCDQSGQAGALFGAYRFIANSNQYAGVPSAGATGVNIVQSGSSNLKARINGTNTTLSNFTAVTLAGGFIGFNVLNSFGTSPGEQFFGFVLYPTQLSDADAASIETASSTIFSAPTNRTKQIVSDGDSITAGFLYGIYDNGRVQKAITALNSPSTIFGKNLGVNSQTMATIYANRTNATSKFNAGLAKNIGDILGGTNDIQAAASGSIVGLGTTIYNNYTLPYVQAMQAAGFLMVVDTILPRGWSGSATDISQKEAERQALNTLIINGALGNGYRVADFGNISQFSQGDANNTPNLTYLPDGIHPNLAGYDLMAPLSVAAITPFL